MRSRLRRRHDDAREQALAQRRIAADRLQHTPLAVLGEVCGLDLERACHAREQFRRGAPARPALEQPRHVRRVHADGVGQVALGPAALAQQIADGVAERRRAEAAHGALQTAGRDEYAAYSANVPRRGSTTASDKKEPATAPSASMTSPEMK